MSKYSFKNDYAEGCHPLILEKLMQSNFEQSAGYGEDAYCEAAKKTIQKQLKSPKSDIHFVVGGTQANLICISSVLKPHQAVITAETGHIAVHETGAIEATGHKVITIQTKDGKLNQRLISKVLRSHTDEHMVQPKMVYISNSTEIGTVYTKKELKALHQFCQDKGLILFMDGARLGAALTSWKNDLKLSDLAKLTDIFYIGGTKNGALLGEAIVINNSNLQADFRYHIKQKGGLLAKGKLLGIQFLTLFEEQLFFELAQRANMLNQKLAQEFTRKNYKFLVEPQSNQLFPILPNHKIAELEKDFEFYRWKKINPKHSAIRLVTSWATDESQVDRFLELI